MAKKKTRVVRHQKPVSFRLSPEGIELLKSLSERLGINQTAVVELAIRQLARQEPVVTVSDVIETALRHYMDNREGKGK